MHFKSLIYLLLFMISTQALAYELVVIQGVSREKQTFITRKGKAHGIFEGKNATFTSQNVSVIAKAVTVTREFTQWEIKNDYTDLPFRRGEVITMYDANEYLWALTPEAIKRKYVKTKLYKPRRSMEAHMAFTSGISESVSGTPAQNTDRGGFQFEGLFRKEFSINWAMAFGIRYTRETVNLPEASLINTRFLGILEGRYYFDPMDDFYDAQIGLSLGFGYGQSRTDTSGFSSFGSAFLIPSTKISLEVPINREYDFAVYGAFESLRTDESSAENVDQTTNLTASKVGIMFRKHL